MAHSCSQEWVLAVGGASVPPPRLLGPPGSSAWVPRAGVSSGQGAVAFHDQALRSHRTHAGLDSGEGTFTPALCGRGGQGFGAHD